MLNHLPASTKQWLIGEAYKSTWEARLPPLVVVQTVQDVRRRREQWWEEAASRYGIPGSPPSRGVQVPLFFQTVFGLRLGQEKKVEVSLGLPNVLIFRVRPLIYFIPCIVAVLKYSLPNLKVPCLSEVKLKQFRSRNLILWN